MLEIQSAENEICSWLRVLQVIMIEASDKRLTSDFCLKYEGLHLFAPEFLRTLCISCYFISLCLQPPQPQYGWDNMLFVNQLKL